MAKSIFSTVTVLALVTSLLTAPASPVLAREAAPAADVSSPGNAAGVPGSVWAWGSKGATGLGDGKTFDSKVPVPLGLSGVVEIAVGDLHALALKADGTVWAWGLNSTGQIGDGTTTNRNTPVQVSGLSGVTDIAAGARHSLAVTSEGYVWAWGDNTEGQLGDNTVTNRLAPVRVFSSLTGATAVAAGDSHSLALKAGGTIWAWGNNFHGQLGDGTTIRRLAPVPVGSGLTDIQAIAAGDSHSLALTADSGTKGGAVMFGWGNNADRQIPNEITVSKRLFPVAVLNNVIAIAAGERHSLAVQSAGNVWAFGYNQHGQLGDGTTTNSPALGVAVKELTGVTAVAAGNDHSLAVTTGGTVWAWGYNYYGQLGDGSITNRLTPVQLSGLTGVTAIAGRNFYSLAIKSDPSALTAVTGTAPVTVAPQPVTQTPSTTTTPSAPALTPVATPAPVTAAPPKTAQTASPAPIPSTGLVPIAKATPRAAPNPSGSLVYMSPERMAGPSSGGIVSLSIWVAAGSHVISSGDLSLSFDPSALEMTSITPGTVFGPTPMLVKNDYSNANGTAQLVAARAAGSAPPPPPPPPVPPATGGAAALTPASPDTTATPAAPDTTATPAAPSAEAQGSEADRILAAIAAAANAEAERILAILNSAVNTNAAANTLADALGAANANAAANTLASALGAPSSTAPVADADAPSHHAAVAVPDTSPTPATGTTATGGAPSPPPPSGIAYGTQGGGSSAGGPPSGNAYFGSPETGYVASASLVVIKFKVKSTAKPGDYQVSISKAGLADAKGQDIPIRLITGSTITIGGAMKMGDLTGDGLVDYRDLGVFAGAYGTSSAQNNFNSGADLNGDGLINYLDLAIFGANYGK